MSCVCVCVCHIQPPQPFVLNVSLWLPKDARVPGKSLRLPKEAMTKGHRQYFTSISPASQQYLGSTSETQQYLCSFLAVSRQFKLRSQFKKMPSKTPQGTLCFIPSMAHTTGLRQLEVYCSRLVLLIHVPYSQSKPRRRNRLNSICDTSQL